MTQSKASQRPGGEDWRYCGKAAQRSSRHTWGRWPTGKKLESFQVAKAEREGKMECRTLLLFGQSQRQHLYLEARSQHGQSLSSSWVARSKATGKRETDEMDKLCDVEKNVELTYPNTNLKVATIGTEYTQTNVRVYKIRTLLLCKEPLQVDTEF
jgi:hypothetical protein